MAKYFSSEGLSFYHARLEDLKQIAKGTGKEIGEEAGMNCDWHDNFGFEDAQRRFELDSRRANELSTALGEAQVVEAVEQSVRVAIGNTVQILEDDTTEKEVTVGAWGESSPEHGLVSYESPLGKTLIGAEVGDSRTINIGGKTRTIEIIEIFPPSHKYRGLVKTIFTDRMAESKSSQ